jgi:hypothetical protein
MPSNPELMGDTASLKIKGVILPSFIQGKWRDHVGNTRVGIETDVQVGDEFIVTNGWVTMLRPQLQTHGQAQPLWFIVKKIDGSTSVAEALQLDDIYTTSPSTLLFGQIKLGLAEYRTGQFKVLSKTYAGAIHI